MEYLGKFFTKDVEWAEQEKRPVVFWRSKNAWRSHPRNYEAIEKMVTEAGRVLFGKRLDYFWCYLVVEKLRLEKILKIGGLRENNWGFMVKTMIDLASEVVVKEVDWLEWEDPWVERVDRKTLLENREMSKEEDKKRLDYALAGLEIILDKYRAGRSSKIK